MLKTIIVSLLLAGMIGWTVYSQFDVGEQASPETSVSDESPDDAALNDIPEEEIGLEEGDYAPDFTLEALDGETVSLSDFRGEKKVMVNFWATWCPPCRAEMPDMQRVYEDRDDVEILAVNLTDTEAALSRVESFRDERSLTFPILLDEQTDTADLYNIQPVPTTYMVDTEGRIAHASFGPMNEEMIARIFDTME
jgi:peroxiredoxin